MQRETMELRQLRTENISLQQNNASLQQNNATLQQNNATLQQQIVILLEEIGTLQEYVALMLGETKEDSPYVHRAKSSRYAYISQKILLQFQPSVNPSDIPYEQIAWWKMIFSYIQPNDYERLHLRRLCNMFKASLKPPPKGKWTEYPHLNHASIDSLINRCKELHEENPRKAPTIFFIKAGEHVVEVSVDEDDEDEDGRENQLLITYPMKIIGAGRDKTIIHGGFDIRGTNEEGKRVDMKDMTISETSGYGVIATNGLSWLCDSLTITQCGDGVYAIDTKGRLINCVITQCYRSGIFCLGRNALIELEGYQTKVEGNVTGGCSSSYGLRTYSTSSRIHLLIPLTKESVSTNNHGGRNYGGNGTIKTVDSFETSCSSIPGTL